LSSRWPRLALSILLPLALLPAAGCSPIVICRIETEILPDYTCRRIARLDIKPNPRSSQQRLANYFQFPPAELYDTYAIRQEGAVFAGDFSSYDQIPSDLIRNLPGVQAKARNVFSYQIMDTVLFVLAHFDETLIDVVAGEEDGQAALAEMIRLCLPEIMAVLNARYGAHRDLSRLEAWLGHDLPAKAARLYDGAWRVHAAKRSGVTSPGEEYEYYLFLMAEARREGLELAPPETPNLWDENLRRLKEYGLRLAERLCPPRPGAPARESGFPAASLGELAAALQKAITARHGSINAFIAKLSALAPRAFGVYLLSSILPFLALPETQYHYRLRPPGQVIQTNGVREMNGDLVWNFTDRDLAFTGQSMWAKTIMIREPVVLALDLKGFPASLDDVDRLYGLCLTPAGKPRETLLETLAKSANAGSQAPLEALANNPSAPDAAAAREVIEFFARFRQARPAAQPPAATPPAPPIPPSPIPPAPGPR
jgi:hypothetical protein